MSIRYVFMLDDESWLQIARCCDDQSAVVALAATCREMKTRFAPLLVDRVWDHALCAVEAVFGDAKKRDKRRHRLVQIYRQVLAFAKGTGKLSRGPRRKIECGNSFERAFALNLASACNLVGTLQGGDDLEFLPRRAGVVLTRNSFGRRQQ